MRIADFVLVLPALYVALALRGTLPLVLSTGQVFATLAIVFGAIGWPAAARGVRGIITVERSRQYTQKLRHHDRRVSLACDLSSSPAFDRRLSRRPGNSARAGLRDGRSRVIPCRIWICASRGELGDDDRGSGEWRRSGRRAVAPWRPSQAIGG